MTPPRAAGIRMSQSSTKIELGSMASPPPKPLTPRFSFTWLSRFGMWSPLLFFIAPVTSLTATTVPPCSLMSWAAHEPTFPNPCHQEKIVSIINSLYLPSEQTLLCFCTWIVKGWCTGVTCKTNRWPAMLFPYSLSRASAAKSTPLPVAASLPRDPPRSWYRSIYIIHNQMDHAWHTH